MIALRFFASGLHLQVIGDTMGHDKSTVSRVIRQVTDALVLMKDTFIKWAQTPEKLNSVKNGFYQKEGFPNAFIGGTHVPIQATVVDEPSFVNGKGFHNRRNL